MQKIILQTAPKAGYTFLRPVSKRRPWKWIFIFIGILVFGYGVKSIFAQTSTSTSAYIPLIGLTSVPDPLVLPKGPGEVTYNYAVKNFTQGVPLGNVQVVDNNCSPIKFITGDDNGNAELDFGETWKYSCVARISTTTQSVATATGVANNLTAAHNAYTTVVVGANITPPLISIINITKVAYPLSLPIGGGPVTFTYKVTNPGVVPLSKVTVSDDQCSAMSGELGDTNANGLLDVNEVWIYNCTTILRRTTTNTATVTSYANGLKATDDITITVEVRSLGANTTTAPTLPNEGPSPNPSLPDNGIDPNTLNITVVIWVSLGIVLAVLIILFLIVGKKK